MFSFSTVLLSFLDNFLRDVLVLPRISFYAVECGLSLLYGKLSKETYDNPRRKPTSLADDILGKVLSNSEVGHRSRRTTNISLDLICVIEEHGKRIWNNRSKPREENSQRRKAVRKAANKGNQWQKIYVCNEGCFTTQYLLSPLV